MATPRIVTNRDFNTSRFSQLADTSDVDINTVLAGAETAIESRLRRPIAPTQYVERYRPNDQMLYLRKRPVIDVVSIIRRYSPTSTAFSEVTSYYLDAEMGVIESNESLAGYVVDVTYTAGFEVVPEDIKQAILMQAALLMFQDFELYGSGDAKKPGIMYIADDIDVLLKPYKQIHTAYTER